MTQALSLSQIVVEVVTSWVTLGALFGALADGELADRLGRKRAVLIASGRYRGHRDTAGACLAAGGRFPWRRPRRTAADRPKGRFSGLLGAMPVHVIMVNAALLGAAIYGLEQAARN